MSIRATIIENLRLLVLEPGAGLGLTSASIKMEQISIQDLNFQEFPFAHILDLDEAISYLPNRYIEAKLTPLVRFFFQDNLYANADDFITKLKVLFASNNGFPLGPLPKYVRLQVFRLIPTPNHKFLEIRLHLQINYVYKDGTP